MTSHELMLLLLVHLLHWNVYILKHFFLLFYHPQGRSQKGETSSRNSNARQTASRSAPSTSNRASPSSSASPQYLPSPSSSSFAPSPKLNSLAATHKLKKDIHRCHRMSRRPLPRSDPMAGSFSNPGGLPSRLHVSPFSETVRILNRRVKPREVKRGRIILNLKVIDKPGRGGSSVGSRNVAAGRQNIPSRNRIIGKKGEAPYRPFQPPLKMLGFPMYGKPFGLQYGGPFSFRSSPAASSTTATRDTHSTSTRYRTPPSPSSSSSSGGKSPTSASAGPSEPSEGPQSGTPHAASQASQSAEAPAPAPPEGPAPASLPSSPSSSLDGEKEARVPDSSPSPQECRRNSHPFRAKRQAAVSPREQSCPPAESKRVPAEGDPDWHPEMAPSCTDVVVTDVTTNLVTVTIKEFPSHASPSAGPEEPSTPPPSTSVHSPSPPKP